MPGEKAFSAGTEPRHSPRLSWWKSRAIFPITLLGAVLRLTLLNQPAFWNDEAATYGRVIGTFHEMLQSVRVEGFAPLHYELDWTISRFLHLTPIVLRLVPMLAGILMVPAMYALTRQLAGKWTANAVALFTACSALMLVYSRDAKMYGLFWLFCVLTIWLFLRWLKRGTRLLWLGWVACGLIAIGLHTVGLGLLGLLPLFLLTDRRPHWKKSAFLAMGLLVIAAGPAGYYLKYSGLMAQYDAMHSLDRASKVDWIAGYNQGRTGPDYVLFTTGAYLFAWEWPRSQSYELQPETGPDGSLQDFQVKWVDPASPLAVYFNVNQGDRILATINENGVRNYVNRAAGESAARQAIWNACLPRPSGQLVIGRNRRTLVLPETPGDNSEQIEPLAAAALKTAGVLLIILAGIGVLPWPKKWRAEGPSPWRVRFWLAAWLILPTYAIYCHSVREFLSPLQWMQALGSTFHYHWLAVAGGALCVGGLLSIARQRQFHTLHLVVPPILVTGAAILGVGLIAGPLRASPLAWGMECSLVAGLLYAAAGDHLHPRLGRLAVFMLVLGGIALLCQVIYWGTSAQPTGSIWMPRYLAFIWPAFAIILCGLFSRLPMRWLRYAALGLLLVVNLRQFTARIATNINVPSNGPPLITGSEPPTDLLATDIIHSDARRHDVLVLRSGRLRHDIVIDRSWKPQLYLTTRVYGVVPMHYVLPGPGFGNIDNNTGHYEFESQSDGEIPQAIFPNVDPTLPRHTPVPFELNPHAEPSVIVADVKSNPQLDRIIVWDRGAPMPQPWPLRLLGIQIVHPEAAADDPILQHLGPGWKMTGDERFNIRDYWRWVDVDTARRREYRLLLWGG